MSMAGPYQVPISPNSREGISIMKKIAVVLAALLVAACSSTQKTDTSQASQADNAATAATTAAEKTADQLASEMQALQQQSTYFDFDKSVVKQEYQDAIKKQAEFIKGHSNDVVTLEGNADERGSTEYNLALGNKRATAVKRTLEILGVPSQQIRTVSFGESRPRSLCHEEECWKENRRVDFVHKLD